MYNSANMAFLMYLYRTMVRSIQAEDVHVTSSPYHPKSNGKAESAVKGLKSIFKKALKDNRDVPWLALTH